MDEIYQSHQDEFMISNQSIQIDKLEEIQNHSQPQSQFLPQYRFPVLLLLHDTIQKNQFKSLMKEEADGSGYEKGWRVLKSKNDNPRLIYIRCNHCKAALYYKQQGNDWQLIKYKNIHNHKTKKVEKSLLKKVLSKNLHLSDHQLYENIQTRCSVSKNQLIKMKQNLSKQCNFQLIKNYLLGLSYQFKFQVDSNNMSKEGYPDILVAVSKIQKRNYQRYGQSISYDITYNCIKQATFDGRNFSLGIFYGFQCNNRISIFGFSLTACETTNGYKKIFSWFFDLMGVNQTTAVITTQQKKLIESLRELKEQDQQRFNFHHVFDNWHFIKDFRLQLKQEKTNLISNLTQKLCNLMQQSDPNRGLQRLDQLKLLMKKNTLKQKYKILQNKFQNICLWKMPKKFIGLARHSNQSINDLLRFKTQNQFNILNLIERIDKVCIQRNKKYSLEKKFENYPFEDLFEDDQIKEIRDLFQKQIFNAFAINYKKSEYYQTIYEQSQNKYIQLIQKFNKYKYSIQDNVCSCGASEKTGIPCQHLIFINKKTGYVNLFHKRWLPIQQVKSSKNEVVNSKLRKRKI